MVQGSKFTHINEHFCCENCGGAVAPVKTGCRNHCPHCLVSKHADVYPGDRANECQGLMDAVAYETSGKKGLMLVFRCRRCGAETRNMAAHEDPVMPDDYDKILKLGRPP
jgi:DNA-directed RNA polymerase subunit RPC12/RpoP